jgi:hypothetical protein
MQFPSRSEAPSAVKLVHLPRTATSRNAITYIKLIHSVKIDHTFGGYRFDGPLFRPHATIEEAELRPSPDYPKIPLLLECAGPAAPGLGHKRAKQLYILWKYDPARRDWDEVARTAAVDRDWTVDLGPIARRELQTKPILVDPPGIADRVLLKLEDELEPLERRAQRLVLLAVYDRFASRVANQ